MHKHKFLSFISFLQLLAVCRAILPQLSNIQDISLPFNVTYPSLPPTSLNASVGRRYFIPNTPLAIDFWHQAPRIPGKDVLMCVVIALSEIFGNKPSDPIPSLSTFKYSQNAFIHVQDLNPTPGRPHTYQDLASTLRGVGEYMTAYDEFWTTEFQVWERTTTVELKIGSGGVGGKIRSQADAAGTSVPAQTEIPACNRGNQRCVE